MADLTTLPHQITAGDSYTLTLTRPDYPASAGWSLSWSVAGPSVDSWASVASGDAHVFTLPAADTTALLTGDYATALKAIRAGVVHTIATPRLTVAADVAAFAPGEAVSYWAQLKEAAQAALTTILAGGAVQMTMIMGRQMMFRSPNDCLKVIAYCDARLTAQQGSTFGTPIRFDVVGMR